MHVDALTEAIPRRSPPPERLTFDDFCEIIREDQKADLIDGVIYMASPASLEHEEEFGFIFMVVRGYVRRLGLGSVLGSRAAMKLSELDAPEPDLMFISKDKLARAAGKAVLGAADLVIEIAAVDWIWWKRKRFTQNSASSNIGLLIFIARRLFSGKILMGRGKTSRWMRWESCGRRRCPVSGCAWIGYLRKNCRMRMQLLRPLSQAIQQIQDVVPDSIWKP